MNIRELIEICDGRIEELKSNISKSDSLNNEKYLKELEILIFTKRILQTRGEKAFFEMDMNTSLKMLDKLVDRDEVMAVYAELISPNRFVSKDREPDEGYEFDEK